MSVDMRGEGALRVDTRSLAARWYAGYVLAVLLLAYAVNVMDRSVLAVLLESIKHTFHTTDTQQGLLGGLAFALFYATLGVPIAALADRTSRRNVLAACALLWSVMTALCGLATSFPLLLAARVGTAVGEAGGTPPSHSLVSDYFPLSTRATALSLYALGVPLGSMLGSLLGGWGNELYGWRNAFMLVGTPGVLIALLVFLTIKEPARGQSDAGVSDAARLIAPKLSIALRYLWRQASFRHMAIAAGLHSLVWYSGSTLNAAFLHRSHGMTSGEAGSWLALFAGTSAVGTFLGGYLADRISVQTNDRRWYLWVPAYATLAMVPFQFSSYLAASLGVMVPSFVVMLILGSFFFGPSFAMSQGLAPLRMRAVATSLVLFIQTLVGLGLGPLIVGMISDHLKPSMGDAQGLRYGLVSVGVVNLWAAFHYFRGAHTVREDLVRATRY
ncbi:MAG TPA: MFS transporter, partial [Steroidobacteraceae bacterium]